MAPKDIMQFRRRHKTQCFKMSQNLKTMNNLILGLTSAYNKALQAMSRVMKIATFMYLRQMDRVLSLHLCLLNQSKQMLCNLLALQSQYRPRNIRQSKKLSLLKMLPSTVHKSVLTRLSVPIILFHTVQCRKNL